MIHFILNFDKWETTHISYRNYIYGFILMAKGNSLEFYHQSKDFVNQWIEALKDSVILVDLKEDYIIH